MNQMESDELMSISSHYQSIFQVRGNSKSQLVDQLVGTKPLNAEVIVTPEDFDELYKIRHDLIHAIICDVRKLPFGEKKVEDVLKSNSVKIIDDTYFDLIKKQTPDYFFVNKDKGLLIEISVSRSESMEAEKVSKYSLLNYFLRRNKIQMNNEYIIINPDSVYRTRDNLIKLHQLTDPAVDAIKSICDKVRKLESDVKMTEMGRNYTLQKQHIMTEEEDIKVSIDDVIRIYDSNKNKVFHSKDDLYNIIKGDGTNEDESEDFLSYVASLVENIKPKLATNEVFDEKKIIDIVNEESKRLNGELQTEKRSIFPLPYFKMKSTDAMIRSTDLDYSETCKIATRMMRSDDVILSSFGKGFLDNHPKQPNRPDDERYPEERRE